MEEINVDMVVIGSGPGGQKAAIQAAKLGKKVVMIEKDNVPGGASLNSGTIPSKSLREAIIDLTGFRKRSFYGQERTIEDISISDLNFRLNMVWDFMRHELIEQFKKNHIDFVQGCGRFEDDHTVAVVDANGEVTARYKSGTIMIATGSKPRNPNHIPFDDVQVLDSTRLLSMDRLPKNMVVMGGGIIGSEYASFFAALGTQVTVVDKREQILPLLDKEIGKHLQKDLTDIGLQFLGGKEMKEVVQKKDGVVVKFTDGSEIESEKLLYALGREAHVDGLCLEKTGITLTDRGYVPVNALFQTCVPHIYAVGDVVGAPALASTSMEQGRLAARHACGVETHRFPTFFPVGIYTIPEISSCGYTEEELQELGFHFEVGRAHYSEIGKNQFAGSEPGLFKILFHAETLEILGVHIIGRDATELIHIGQVAMTNNARIDYLIDQVFNYPTFAEGYRIAAFNGLNKITHRK